MNGPLEARQERFRRQMRVSVVFELMVGGCPLIQDFCIASRNLCISQLSCYSEMELYMRMRLNMLSVFVLLVGAHLFAADEFTIDPAHSSANFAVKHLMISTVHGRFSDVSGTILYDEKDPSKSSVLAVIRAASVNTDNQTRDKDLRSANFFETDKYPEIRFQSTKVEKIGDQLQVTGNLTMKALLARSRYLSRLRKPKSKAKPASVLRPAQP
jgi:hypothetical protein